MLNIPGMVKYNADGLIPAIAQDIRTDEVLMLAYMNEESLRKTIETGKVHYYSRSRQKLWLKGETSGHFQKVRSISVDCDADTLLLKVEQTGPACHTGHRSCFYTRIDAEELEEKAGAAAGGTSGAAKQCKRAEEVAAEPASVAGAEVLGEVFDVIFDRFIHPKEGSYTNYLFNKGLDKILKKIGEEASEVIIASKNGAACEISEEIADLLYHVMVLIAHKGMTMDDIYKELKLRQ